MPERERKGKTNFFLVLGVETLVAGFGGGVGVGMGADGVGMGADGVGGVLVGRGVIGDEVGGVVFLGAGFETGRGDREGFGLGVREEGGEILGVETEEGFEGSGGRGGLVVLGV